MAETQLQLHKEIEEISSREQVCASVEHNVYLQMNIYVHTCYFILICVCGWVNGYVFLFVCV